MALESTISTNTGIDFPGSLTEAQAEIVQKSAARAVAKFEAAAKEAGVEFAVRAVNDALPMLMARDEVDVLVVNPKNAAASLVASRART